MMQAVSLTSGGFTTFESIALAYASCSEPIGYESFSNLAAARLDPRGLFDALAQMPERGFSTALGAGFGLLNPIGEFVSAGGAIAGGLIDVGRGGEFLGTGFQAGGLVGGVASGGFGAFALQGGGRLIQFGGRAALRGVGIEAAGGLAGAGVGLLETGTVEGALHRAQQGVFATGIARGATGLVRSRLAARDAAEEIAPRVASQIARATLPKNTTVLAVVKDGKILAQSSDQLLSHAEFVNRTIGSVPKGAEVITIFKESSGNIIANRSLTFHGNALPASQSTLDTVLGLFD